MDLEMGMPEPELDVLLGGLSGPQWAAREAQRLQTWRQFLAENDLDKEYPGQFVAVVDGEVIATGSADEVFSAVRERGLRDAAFIHRPFAGARVG